MEVKAPHRASQLSSSSIYGALKSHQKALQQTSFAQAHENDPTRSVRYKIQLGSIIFYYGNNLITDHTLSLFGALAQETHIKQRCHDLFTGKPVNVTENQPALHIAYRGNRLTPQSARETVCAEKKQLEKISQRLRQAGYTDCIHIGIGGSDIGPRLLHDAFSAQYESLLNMHYLSSLDPCALEACTRQCDPQRTAVIVASKSFSTTETLLNAKAIKEWLSTHGVKSDNQWFAVTAYPDRAVSLGLAAENILTIPHWVGGRYGIWSSMSLSIVANFGMQPFEAFLEGGALVDEHTLSAPFEENIPQLMAMLGVWYTNAWGRQTHVIAPYAYGLRKLIPYCQQLDMESLGKSSTLDGKSPLLLDSGPAIWGGLGPEFQHAFGQSLHQGTFWAPIDFIVPVQAKCQQGAEHQNIIVANAISQASMLFKGASHLEPCKQLTGNRPSNTLFIKQLDAFHLGALIALYEHKVFVQSVVWGLNPFDQFGVEWGKELAKKIMTPASQSQEQLSLDATTKGMLCVIQGL